MPPKYEKISIHNYSSNNVKAFQSYLTNTDFTPRFRSDNVDDALNILDTNLNKYHDHFFPLKVIKRHPKFIYKPPQESLNAIKLKKKLHRKLKTKLEKVSSSSCDSCGACNKCINTHLAWDEYRKQRNLTNKFTKANKRENLVNDLKAKSAKNDLKGIYQSIRLAANLPSKSNTQSIKDDKIINAENLNEHFCDIGPNTISA